MVAIVLEKGHPERKGCVERANGYLETSFLPGREFTSVDDFNTQLSGSLKTRANVRVQLVGAAGSREPPGHDSGWLAPCGRVRRRGLPRAGRLPGRVSSSTRADAPLTGEVAVVSRARA